MGPAVLSLWLLIRSGIASISSSAVLRVTVGFPRIYVGRVVCMCSKTGILAPLPAQGCFRHLSFFSILQNKTDLFFWLTLMCTTQSPFSDDTGTYSSPWLPLQLPTHPWGRWTKAPGVFWGEIVNVKMCNSEQDYTPTPPSTHSIFLFCLPNSCLMSTVFSFNEHPPTP